MARMTVDSWPERDRQLWLTARAAASILDAGGDAANWRPSTVRLTIDAYSAWLEWLDQRGDLSVDEHPAARVTKPRIKAYIAHLRTTLADATVAMRLHHLYRAVQAMTDGTADIAWLGRLARRMSAAAKPARSKTPRLVDSTVLYALGLRLIELAGIQLGTMSRDSAVQYRDGLMIAMLACRPLRLGELMALRMGETMRKEGSCYVVRLGPDLTKSKRHLEAPYPAALTPLIDRYVDQVRPELARAKKGERVNEKIFWLSRRGRAMAPNHVSHCISRLTYLHLKRDLSPHLFRDCAATSIAITDPGHIGIVKDVLGHTTFRTGEKYYNQAGAVSALRRFHTAVLAGREEPNSSLSPRVNKQ